MCCRAEVTQFIRRTYCLSKPIKVAACGRRLQAGPTYAHRKEREQTDNAHRIKSNGRILCHELNQSERCVNVRAVDATKHMEKETNKKKEIYLNALTLD